MDLSSRANSPVAVWMEMEAEGGTPNEIYMARAEVTGVEVGRDGFTFEIANLGDVVVTQHPKRKKFKHTKETP